MTRHDACILGCDGCCTGGPSVQRLSRCKDGAMGTQPTRRGEGISGGSSGAPSAHASRELILNAGQHARRSRIAQGLPVQVEDPVTLANIAMIVRAGLRVFARSDAPDEVQPGRLEIARGLGSVDGDPVQDRRDDASLLLERKVRPGVSDVRTRSSKEIA
jgi:hypothetical protein